MYTEDLVIQRARAQAEHVPDKHVIFNASDVPRPRLLSSDDMLVLEISLGATSTL